MLETVSLEGMLIYSQQNMLQNMFKTFLLAKPQSLVKKEVIYKSSWDWQAGAHLHVIYI